MQTEDTKHGRTEGDTPVRKSAWTAPRLTELPVTATQNGPQTGADSTGASAIS